ncbi:acyltransferase family protein [Curtobacterium sp. NPDC087082]|uniref:acyltransferase family protein n=1 Tax=Curtobacterium sp. NPDC087082 TaxID=3363966 RepID=UPI0037F20D68
MTTDAPARQRARLRSTAPHRFRTDIEGLRGAAVLVVLAYHAFGLPRGGFTGVDVFFVISGFLITGILLREVDRTGRVSIIGFYGRRARRILPAALLVLLVTVTGSALVWFSPRAWAIALDGIASALFVQNWHLIAEGTDYLHATDPASPLQHFWSLAVEEQFYAVWPIVMVLATVPSARRVLGRRGPLIVAVVLTAASMTFAAVESTISPSIGYFDSVSRAWELGAGAVLAMAGPVLGRLAPRVHTVLFWTGLALIAASAFLVTSGTAFPWPSALAPVVGTVLVLAAGDRVGRSGAVLRNRPLRWVGRISYSLYLWHFPVVVIVAGVYGTGVLPMSIAVLGSLALAAASERWVERPFLRSAPRRHRSDTGDRTRARRVVEASLASVTIVVLGALSLDQLRGASVFRPAQELAARITDGAPADSTPRAAFTPDDLPGRVSQAVQDAAAGRTESSLVRAATPESLAPALAADGCRNGLHDGDITDPRTCEWGAPDAPKTAVVIGDSVALSWTPAVVSALDDDWRVIAVGYALCPVGRFTPGVIGTQLRYPGQCERAQQAMLDAVADVRPDLVIASSAESYPEHMQVPSGSTAAAAWQRSTEDSLRALEASAGRVVLLEGTPDVDSPTACANRITGVAECTGTVRPIVAEKRAAEERAVSAVGGDTHYVPTTSWLCTPEGACPLIIDGTLVRPDPLHLTAEMSERLGAVMRDALGV